MARNEYENRLSQLTSDYTDELVALYLNAIRPVAGTWDEPRAVNFAKRELLTRGWVGYLHADRPVGGFYRVNPLSLDRYGEPMTVNLSTFTGVNVGNFWTEKNSAPLDGHYIDGYASVIRASGNKYAVIRTINNAAECIARAMINALSNLDSSNTAPIIAVKKELKSTIDEAMRRRRVGEPVVVGTDELLNAFASAYTGTQYIADKAIDAASFFEGRALSRIGTTAANQYKRERTPAVEADAGIGATIDAIYITIDQFNADAEAAGITERLEYNGYAAKFDVDETEEGGDINA